MCGLWAFITHKPNIYKKDYQYQLSVEKHSHFIKHRGPDNTNIFKNDFVSMIFHRLSIVGLDKTSDQPFISRHNGIVTMCNGEIYNNKNLIMKHKLKSKTNSDCEVIHRMFIKGTNMYSVSNELDGVFAYISYNWDTGTLIFARDPLGVRPLFIGYNGDDQIALCSEAKGLTFMNKIEPVHPGTCVMLSLYSKIPLIEQYHSRSAKYIDLCIKYELTPIDELECMKSTIYSLLKSAVLKRLQSDQPIGILLSGGFDSSTIAALAIEELVKTNKPIHLFSIGLDNNSPDIQSAILFNDFITKKYGAGSTIHHICNFTLDEGIATIPEVIYQIESWDVTTVRASTPMYLLSKYIVENTDVKVLLSGEAPDETWGSYLYFANAPSAIDFYNETVKLVKNLHYFDVLRCDRSTAGHGLEVRVPFMDKKVIEYCLHDVPASVKMYSRNGIEKHLLRETFCTILPSEIAWRRKDAFSDAVGTSWKDYIKKYCSLKYPELDPISAEIHHYKTIFETFYPNRNNLIPYQWLPNQEWIKIRDPSARLL